MTNKLTQEQQDWVCYQIGEWYMDWKRKIVADGSSQHRLGIAKEDLKMRLCEDDRLIDTTVKFVFNRNYAMIGNN